MYCQPHSKGDRFHLPSSHIMSHSSLPEFPKPATEGEKKLPDSLRHVPKESPDTVRESNLPETLLHAKENHKGELTEAHLRKIIVRDGSVRTTAGISPGELPEPLCTPALSSTLMGLKAEPVADGNRDTGHIPRTVTALGRAAPALHGRPHLCKSGCGSQLRNQGKDVQQEHFGKAPALLATSAKVIIYTSNRSRTQNTSGEEFCQSKERQVAQISLCNTC